jgi:hypothetical protein
MSPEESFPSHVFTNESIQDIAMPFQRMEHFLDSCDGKEFNVIPETI